MIVSVGEIFPVSLFSIYLFIYLFIYSSLFICYYYSTPSRPSPPPLLIPCLPLTSLFGPPPQIPNVCFRFVFVAEERFSVRPPFPSQDGEKGLDANRRRKAILPPPPHLTLFWVGGAKKRNDRPPRRTVQGTIFW